MKVGELWAELRIDDSGFDRGLDKAMRGAQSKLKTLPDAKLGVDGRGLEQGVDRAVSGAGAGLGRLSGMGRQAAADTASAISSSDGLFARAGGRIADAAGGGLQRLKSTARDVTQDIARNLDDIGDRATAFGSRATIAAGAAGFGLLQAAQGADELAASTRRIEGNLGAASGEAIDFAKNANKIGLSDRAASGFVATIAEMQIGMGVASDTAGKLTIKTVDLVSRLAALKGVRAEDALEAVQAALIGEYDGLQRLVPSITAAKIEQEAMAASGKKNADQLTAGEKATAALNIITSDAAATIERAGGAQETLALKTAKARADLDDLVTSIGAGAQPMIGFLAETLGDAAERVDSLPGPVKSTAGAIGGIAIAVTGTAGAVSFLAGHVLQLRDRFTTVGEDGVRSLNNVGRAAKVASIAAGAIGAALILDQLGKSDASQYFDQLAATAESNTKKVLQTLGLAGKATKGFTDNFSQGLTDSLIKFKDGTGASLADIDRGLGDAYKAKSFDDITKGIAALRAASKDPINAPIKPEMLTVLKDYEGKLKDAAAAEEAKGQKDGPATQAQEALNTALEGGADAAGEATRKIADYTTNIDTLRELQGITEEGVRGFSEAMKASSGSLNENLDAAQGVGSAFKQLGTDIGALPQSYDLGAAAAGKYSDEQNKALDSLQAVGAAVQTQLETLLATNSGYDQVRLAAAGYEAQLRTQLDQLGITGAAQEDYIRLLGLTPQQVETAIRLSGAEQAQAQLQFLQADIDTLTEPHRAEIYALVAQNDWTGAKALYDQFKSKEIRIGVNVYSNIQSLPAFGKLFGPNAAGWATGGPIPGTGSGDTVPAMLTPGEYVIRKDAAAKLGRPLLDRLNSGGRIVDTVQHFARGGEVQSALTAINTVINEGGDIYMPEDQYRRFLAGARDQGWKVRSFEDFSALVTMNDGRNIRAAAVLRDDPNWDGRQAAYDRQVARFGSPSNPTPARGGPRIAPGSTTNEGIPRPVPKDYVESTDWATAITAKDWGAEGVYARSVLAAYKRLVDGRPNDNIWEHAISYADWGLEGAVARAVLKAWAGLGAPKFHDGGVVPGPLGTETPAVLAAGETVRTREQESALQTLVSQVRPERRIDLDAILAGRTAAPPIVMPSLSGMVQAAPVAARPPELGESLKRLAASTGADLDRAVNGGHGGAGGLATAARTSQVDVSSVVSGLESLGAKVERLATMADRGDTFHVTAPSPERAASATSRRIRSDRWLKRGF